MNLEIVSNNCSIEGFFFEYADNRSNELATITKFINAQPYTFEHENMSKTLSHCINFDKYEYNK